MAHDTGDMATANRLIECKSTKDVLAVHLLKDCTVEMCVAERFEYGAKYLLQLCGDAQSRRRAYETSSPNRAGWSRSRSSKRRCRSAAA